MNINFYRSQLFDHSAKIAVILGTMNVVSGMTHLWNLRQTPSLSKEEQSKSQDLSQFQTRFHSVKTNLHSIVSKTGICVHILLTGLSLYALAKYSNDPCSFPKLMIEAIITKGATSRMAAEKICRLLPLSILNKCAYSQLTGKNLIKNREVQEKACVDIIHKWLQITATVMYTARGIHSIYSNFVPLQEAWEGVPPEIRASRRLAARYGEEILNFDVNDPRDKVLMLYEHDRIQNIDVESSFQKAFQNDHDLKIKLLAPDESAYEEICNALSTKKLKAVYHQVHGSDDLIYTIRPNDENYIKKCFSELIPQQKENPVYILHSCFAGSKLHDSPAQQIAIETGMKVFATRESTSNPNLIVTNTNPPEVAFTSLTAPWEEVTVTYKSLDNDFTEVSHRPVLGNSLIEQLMRTLDCLSYFFRN